MPDLYIVLKKPLIVHRAIRKRDKYFNDKRQSERKHSTEKEISTVSTRNATDTVKKLEKANGSVFEPKIQNSKSVKSGGSFTFCSTFCCCFFNGNKNTMCYVRWRTGSNFKIIDAHIYIFFWNNDNFQMLKKKISNFITESSMGMERMSYMECMEVILSFILNLILLPEIYLLPGDSGKDAQLTAMLLLVTTCFLIFTSPQYIRYILFANSNIYKDVKTFAKLSLLYQCTQKSFFTNRLEIVSYCSYFPVIEPSNKRSSIWCVSMWSTHPSLWTNSYFLFSE